MARPLATVAAASRAPSPAASPALQEIGHLNGVEVAATDYLAEHERGAVEGVFALALGRSGYPVNLVGQGGGRSGGRPVRVSAHVVILVSTG